MKTARRSSWIKLVAVLGTGFLTIILTQIKLDVGTGLLSPSVIATNLGWRPPPNHVNTKGTPYVRACSPNIPYEFEDEVDFRIIVITYNRAKSLQTLLATLNELVIGNDTAVLEIFLDRDTNNEISNETLQTAIDFDWKVGGRKDVFVWKEHAGLYGQWIDSWRPKPGTKEIALIIEDDLSVSPWAYKWLKAAHAHYDNRAGIAGYSLFSGKMPTAIGRKPIKVTPYDVSYMYKIVGSFGFSPHPTHWTHFQDWYHEAIKNKTFHPYVPGTLMTKWYESFERNGRASSMWEMWFIWYTDKHNLYCVFNNIDGLSGKSASYLIENRHEPGLHWHGKGLEKSAKLLMDWDEAYVKFPNCTKRLDYNGDISLAE